MQAQLQEKGIRTFVPMMWREKKLVPAVGGLVFALATREALDSYIRSFGDARPVNYYWDRTANRPLTVPDKAMEDFIHVSRVMSDEALYLKDITEKLHEGQKVRVTEGPFQGVEGTILRIKRSRRVVVELPGLLAVATSYIDPRFLEVL